MTELHKIIKICAIALAILLIISIASGVLKVLGVLTGISLWNERNHAEPVDQSFGPFSEEVRSLELEIGAADIHIVVGDVFRGETDNPYIEVTERGGRLTIREKSHIADLEGSNLTIYIPRDRSFQEVDVTTGAGRIQVEFLNCEKLELDLGAGQAVIEDMTVTADADVDGGAGQILINNGQFHNLSFDMGVGETVITAALTGKTDLSAGVGALRMTVLGSKEDYTIHADQGIGRILIDGTSCSDDSRIGTGPNRIELDGGIGDIQLDFTKTE